MEFADKLVVVPAREVMPHMEAKRGVETIITTITPDDQPTHLGVVEVRGCRPRIRVATLAGYLEVEVTSQNAKLLANVVADAERRQDL